jgi:tetratricopeptide (TPR) repeat protein
MGSKSGQKPQKKRGQAHADRDDRFVLELESALEHIADATWLRAHSPLAAPYFLGHASNDADPGTALRNVLRECAAELPQDDQSLLNAAYFQRDGNLNNVGVAMSLGMIDRTFYRQRALAVGALADVLLKRVHPALGAELPRPSAYVALPSRQAVLSEIQSHLSLMQSVSLIGPSGIGKTTLVGMVYEAWARANPVFWHTVRAGLTDRVEQFGYALAYRLHDAGASMTWRQLSADQGRTQPERLLALLRFDLSELRQQGKTPLICVDESDALIADDAAHEVLLEMIDALQHDAALLLLGQRSVLVTNATLQLSGVSADETATLLRAHDLESLSSAQLTAVHDATQANPAMLALFAALHRLEKDRDTDAAIAQLGRGLSYDALFQRVWRRLDDDARAILMHAATFEDAVFDGVYLDRAGEHAAAIARVVQTGLLKPAVNDPARFELVGHARRAIRERTPPETAVHCALLAADACERRALTLQAMRHFRTANQPAHTLRVWMLRRKFEIDRGQGSAALAVLQTIPADALPDAAMRDTLHLARAELQSLTGRIDEQQDSAGQARRARKPVLRAYARMLEGDAAELRNQLDGALRHYADALDQLFDSPLSLQAAITRRVSRLQANYLNDLQKARVMAIEARVRGEISHGLVEERAGNYAEAEARYDAALALARTLPDYEALLATLYGYLGQLQWKLGKPDAAIAHLNEAVRIGEARGDRIGTLFDRYTISAAHITAGRFQQALDVVEQTLALARSLGSAYLIAGLTGNASEACIGLGRIDDAERFALESLAQEEAALRTYALTALGMVYDARKNSAEAERYFQASIEAARGADDVYAEAAAWRALYDLQRGIGADASAAHDAALALYQRLGLAHEIAALTAK